MNARCKIVHMPSGRGGIWFVPKPITPWSSVASIPEGSLLSPGRQKVHVEACNEQPKGPANCRGVPPAYKQARESAATQAAPDWEAWHRPITC